MEWEKEKEHLRLVGKEVWVDTFKNLKVYWNIQTLGLANKTEKILKLQILYNNVLIINIEQK